MVGAVFCFIHRNARSVFLMLGFSALVLSCSLVLQALAKLFGA